MQWTDEGIVLGSKRHGEANAILELMTRCLLYTSDAADE